LRGISKSAK